MKTLFNKIKIDDLYHKQMKFGLIAGAFVMGGQHLQQMTNQSGDMIAPTFIRHHLSNCADVMFAAPALNILQARLSKQFNFEAISRPFLAAFLAITAGIGYETYTALQPGRNFDFVDTGVYLLSALAYCGITNIQSKQVLRTLNLKS